jgi:YD repeat-containing protein
MDRDPQSQTATTIGDSDLVQNSSRAISEIRASSPEDQAQNVALDVLISMRFSAPVLMRSVGNATVTLEGPAGMVDGTIVAAESGMLAFVNPRAQLLPGSAYTVKVTGVQDRSGQNVAFAEFTFSTVGETATNFGDEEWIPTSDWQTHRAPSKLESLPDLIGKSGTTALAGQILKLNGQPLSHVTLQIGDRRTESDSTGRFLVTDIPPGHQVLVIQGHSADGPGKRYGRFEWGAEIKAGITNQLGFKVWMPALDTAHEVTIPSPTPQETIVTTPQIPGLELHIPANTVITDSEGKVVRKITITPIPLDRTPFPLPFVRVPVFFTIQPGGAYLAVNGGPYKGARLSYPNSDHQDAGIPFAFWNYNADQNGWYVYGNGHVSPDRSRIVPDPGVEIYEFSGAMVGSGSAGPDNQNPAGDPSDDGDPVKLSSGLFVYQKTDLVLPDVIPLSLTRTYRQNDSRSRPFGVGTTHPYEMFIGGDGHSFNITPYVDLILPDGSRIHFTGVGAGPNYTTYLNSAAGTPWYGAILSQSPTNPNNYPLPSYAAFFAQTRDGTIYAFQSSDNLINPGCQGLAGIVDRHGNQVKITRNADANCTINTITSPNGRTISFQYDTSFRVTVATDSAGRSVHYTYDGSGRLQTVTDANNGVWTYGYDSFARMTTIQDARLITYLTNEYDSGGRVKKQTQADGSFYQFTWTVTSNTTNVTFGTTSSGPAPYSVLSFRYCSGCSEGFPPLVTQVDVTDPNGNIRRVAFNSYGYTSTDTRALGKPEQQVTTYAYYADNLLKSVTDQLGRVTTYDYDPNANLSSLTNLSGTANAVTSTFAYDGTYGQLMSVTDPLGHTTSMAYDTIGNLTSVIDPLGHSASFGHTGSGLLTSVTDALQNTTTLTYNSADLIGITDPLQNTTTMFYDAAGRVTSRTDPLGHSTKYQYNNLNQITQVTDSLQGITTLTYDSNGNLLTVQDAKQQGSGNKIVYAYNNMDRLQTRTDPLLRLESYSYDPNGNVTTFTDRRGKVTTLQYDGLDRLKFAGYGTIAGPAYESTVGYSYDGGDRLTGVVDSLSGTITPSFDGLDRLSSETSPQGIITYGYDNASRRTSAMICSPETSPLEM